MRAGLFRDYATVQTTVDVQDKNGGLITEWVTHLSASCKLISKTAREFQRANQVDSAVDYIVMMRVQDLTVDQKMRIQIENGPLLDVIGVTNPDARRRELLITCRERNPVGV